MFSRWIKYACLALALGAALAGCGGGGGDDGAPSSSGESASASIGAAGGTVVGPAGAQVAIPAGALATTTTIGVAQSSAGIPALPNSVTPFGAMFAFTPHGTSFAKAVTITVPFEPALVPAGATPVLYKTNATMTGWAEVAGATVSGSSMNGAVTGFSGLIVGSKPLLPLEKGTPTRHWEVYAYRRDKDLVLPPRDIGDQPSDKPPGEDPADLPAGVQIDKPYDFGPASFNDPALPLPALLPRAFRATGRIFASPGGGSYSVSGEAPIGLTPQSLAGSWLALHQSQSYKKNAANAKLQLLITQARIEAVDQGSAQRELCTLPKTDPDASLCGGSMNASISFSVKAYNRRLGTFFQRFGLLTLDGWRGNWFGDVEPIPGMQQRFLWQSSDFNENKDVDRDGGKHYRRSLKQALPVPVDLSSIDLPNEEFTLEVVAQTEAFNGRPGGEDSGSYVGAFLRDPTQIGGDLQLVTEGLEPTDRPEPPPPSDDPNLPPECRVGPSAGTLQFAAPAYTVAEAVGASGVNLLVMRTDGSAGRVSATVATSDGTATAAGDYQSVRTTVTFEDGDTTPRFVNVPLVYSPDAEGDKAFNVTISAPTGCASLGQATSVVTILDDTRPRPLPTFRLGGTITGLVGSGLTLRTNLFDQLQPTANGAFTFVVPVADGTAYSVSVATPPSNPIQSCTVTNGSGTIAGANVSNIAVDCVTPATNGALDAGFGSQGIVSGVPVTAIARQADGKILAVGGMVVARYNVDGSVDAGFGSLGRVTLVGNGGSLDALKAIALQGDGKILVAGNTSLPTAGLGDDFVVFRLNIDGSPDTSFGSGGKVVTDFAGATDRAVSVMVQSDGKIVAAGMASQGTLVFGVARYLADGTPDPAFGSGGKATVNVTAGGDFANAAALQPDGKIVVVGRTFHERFGRSSGEPDIGIARFRADGTVDTGFGSNGVARVDTTIGATTAPDFDGGNWDDANDVVILADGTIAIGGYTIALGVERPALALVTSDGRLGGVVSSAPGIRINALALQPDGKIVAASSNNNDFALTRFLATGTLDTSFGRGGQLLIDIAGGTDVANDLLLQPDGKIVVVGSASNGASRGSALVRTLP